MLMALLAQVILLFGGAGSWRLLTGSTRRGIVAGIPYAWGFGVAVLYVTGGVAVRVDGLSGKWHYVVAAVCVALGLIALLPGGRPRSGWAETAEPVRPGWRWYEWLVLALILLKAGTVLCVMLVNPVLDSDAVDPLRWVGLAKVIA
ncbi:MAG: hypothetical protein JSU68_05140, partial [Phycisphaerales bacterium]